MSTSETPRTDEAQFGTGRVSVDFARTLERELTAAKAATTEISRAFSKEVLRGDAWKKMAGELAENLHDLGDHQNGCPLPKYEAGWNAAMKGAEINLAAYQKLLKEDGG